MPESALVETYQPFDKQNLFHACGAKYRLFGGAAGPGKSRALLEEAIMQNHEVANSNCLLLRRTYDELEGSIISQFRRHYPWRDIGGHFNESKHIVTWRNGSRLRFGYCRRENDVYQYQGDEFLFIGIDELTLFTLKMWQFLTSRNRCPVPFYTAGENKGQPVFPNMAGASNPGNIGHVWVKSLFIDKVPAPGMDPQQIEEYDPRDYEFIRALVWDNPIYAADANYLKTLRSLPTHLRKAFLEGDWNVFAGQYFDIFELGRHTMTKADAYSELRPWYPRWISIDWGRRHEAAAYWHAQTGNRVITYKEHVAAGHTPKSLGEKIVAMLERDEDGNVIEKIQDVFLSPDAFAKRESENTIADSIGAVLRQSGLPFPTPADDDRVGGWMLMYQCMATDTWTISASCPRLIACIPTLVCDEEHDIEDVLKIDGDDPADSARYGLKTKLSPGKKPLDVRVAERLEKAMGKKPAEVPAEMYTSVMIRRAQILEDEKKKQTPRRFFGRRPGSLGKRPGSNWF